MPYEQERKMKYRIWDRINKRYKKTIFVDQNGDLHFYDDYEPITMDAKDIRYYIIQRCTDLLDMDNKEIYVGDVCEYYKGQHEFKTGIANETGIIKYHNGQFVFDNEMKKTSINEYVKIDSNNTYLRITGNEVNIL